MGCTEPGGFAGGSGVSLGAKRLAHPVRIRTITPMPASTWAGALARPRHRVRLRLRGNKDWIRAIANCPEFRRSCLSEVPPEICGELARGLYTRSRHRKRALGEDLQLHQRPVTDVQRSSPHVFTL